MQIKKFDTVVIELKIGIPEKIENEQFKKKGVWLTLPHAINDKKEFTFYRLVARSDEKKRVVTKDPGFMYTFGRTKAEKNATTAQGVVRFMGYLGLIDSQSEKNLRKLIRKWIYPR